MCSFLQRQVLGQFNKNNIPRLFFNSIKNNKSWKLNNFIDRNRK